MPDAGRRIMAVEPPRCERGRVRRCTVLAYLLDETEGPQRRRRLGPRQRPLPRRLRVPGRLQGLAAGHRLVTVKHHLDERARRRGQRRQTLVGVDLRKRVFEVLNREEVTGSRRASVSSASTTVYGFYSYGRSPADVEVETDEEADTLDTAGFDQTTLLNAILGPSAHLLDYGKCRHVRSAPGEAHRLLYERHSVEDHL